MVVCGLFVLITAIDIIHPMNPYMVKIPYILTWITLLGYELKKIYVTLTKRKEKADYSKVIIILIVTVIFVLDMFR